MSRFKVGDEVVLVREAMFDGKPLAQSGELVVGHTYKVETIGDLESMEVYKGHIDTGHWWCQEDCFELAAGEPSEEEIAVLFGLAPSELDQAKAEIERLKTLLDQHGIEY